MSGLRANQAALSIISSNVANAQTPGYVAQNPNQIEVASGNYRLDASRSPASTASSTCSCRTSCAPRPRGGAYADQIANILGQLQSVYGTPGGDGTLETALNNFTTALQSLSNSPGNSSAQSVGAVGGAVAGAAAEHDHAGHPVAALQRRAGHRQFGRRRPMPT